MTFHQASKFNQQGASFLALGAYDAAYASLTAAATILRDLPVDVQRPEQQHTEEQVHEMLLATEQSVNSCTSPSFLSGCNAPPLKKTDFYIFAQALLFHAEGDEDEEVTEESQVLNQGQHHFCVALVMFNMALGRHAQAKALGKDSYLEKALSLYEMSLEVISEIDIPDLEGVNVLILAAMNNMAEIHYELGNICVAQKLLCSIQPLISELSQHTLARTSADECYVNSLVTGNIATARCA